MLIDALANILFPRICVACRRRVARGVICEACFAGIVLREGVLRHPTRPFFFGAAASYQDEALKSLVHHLKFRSIREAAAPLADILARYVARAWRGVPGSDVPGIDL